MKIIGLTGFAKSGKSTAAEILKKMGGQELAFAKHLKDVCSVVFGVPRDHFDDQDFKEVPFNFSIIISKLDVIDILGYFEIEARYIPQAVLSHEGVRLNSPRHVAQYIGTELLRGIDTNIHIKMAFKLNQGTIAPFLICSDVRFENELKAVQETDGIVIGISRESVIPSDLVNLHPSEKEIPALIERADYTVYNNSSMDIFQTNIKLLSVDYVGHNKPTSVNGVGLK